MLFRFLCQQAFCAWLRLVDVMRCPWQACLSCFISSAGGSFQVVSQMPAERFVGCFVASPPAACGDVLGRSFAGSLRRLEGLCCFLHLALLSGCLRAAFGGCLRGSDAACSEGVLAALGVLRTLSLSAA